MVWVSAADCRRRPAAPIPPRICRQKMIFVWLWALQLRWCGLSLSRKCLLVPPYFDLYNKRARRPRQSKRSGYCVRLYIRRFKRGEYPCVAERSPADAHAGSVVDRVRDHREHRFERRFAAAVGRQVTPVRDSGRRSPARHRSAPARRRGEEWGATSSPHW